MSDAPSEAAETASLSGAVAGGYRVLARKYRPQSFADLIGQDAMVQTLSNAFETGRIPQAWMLTGVRGVGQTTTARILARALNYEVPGEAAAPTIQMEKLGVHCTAIMASEHLDVIEMDAASHTGIDDIRELTDAARYMPASARYKVYIIDEVHMLSKAAFNGLLKTLEEPPAHLKFIFATTEIRKVPVTILSRCQRFDLKRVSIETLMAHLKMIVKKEGVSAEEGALAAIARASEGSVRDALSLLDQAIAFGSEKVTAEGVQQMLGLADFGRVVDLFEDVMAGRIAVALERLESLHNDGADPVLVLNDLATFTHRVTRFKLEPHLANSPAFSEIEKTRGTAMAEKLSLRALARAWQIVLKGIKEVETAPRPLPAADMVLVRLAHAADMPTPDELLRKLGEGGQGPSGNAPAPAVPTPPAPAPVSHLPAPVPEPALPVVLPSEAKAKVGPPKLESFQDVVVLAREKRDMKLVVALERCVRPGAFEHRKIELTLLETAPSDLVSDLSKALLAWTGAHWMIVVSNAGDAPTLYEQRLDREAAMRAQAAEDELVRAVLEKFPGSEIVAVEPVEQPEEATGDDLADGGETDEEMDDRGGEARYQ